LEWWKDGRKEKGRLLKNGRDYAVRARAPRTLTGPAVSSIFEVLCFAFFLLCLFSCMAPVYMVIVMGTGGGGVLSQE